MHGDPGSSSDVIVNYINDNKSYQVNARNVVMACYNMIIPHIVSGLPGRAGRGTQAAGEELVAIHHCWPEELASHEGAGIGMAMSPGNMHQAVLMDFPVSLGGYEYTRTPDDPCVIQMICCPYGTVGAPADEQRRQARLGMLALQFSDYEQEIRRHLSGMFPNELFEFDKDVASISVNRWAHGYSAGGPGDSTRIGRQAFGRITIANTDSAPGADAKTAMMMAHRAVNELG